MRIAFAGTPLAAVPTLTALLASEHDVAFVVTRPDAPAGRGRTLTASPVAEAAGVSGVPVLKTAHLRLKSCFSVICIVKLISAFLS